MQAQLGSIRGKLTASTAALAGLALLAAGCSGDADGRSGGRAGGLEKTTVTVAALPLVDVAPLHIALQRKLFEKEGLTVRIKPVQQSVQALPALANGQLDIIAGANYVTFLQAREKGTLEPRILAEGATLSPGMMDVVVPKDSPVKSAADLKGRSVAVNILNNIQSLTFDAVLAEDEAGPVKYRQIPFPQMGVALEEKQVDAAHVVEPFLTDVKKKIGARVVAEGGASPVEGLPISGYVSTDTFAEKNPRTAAAFRRAVRTAQALAERDRAAVDAVLPGYARISPERARALTLPGFPDGSDPRRMRKLIDLMVREKLLKEAVDPAELMRVGGR
ncbi:ABC transporter substrate-binding protein [Streptomyces cavernicola]|uniref:ABC transporter substrate-binding protein n=1 Tax=Streptomyces cavernicola TaxID=3043613 RepID=A0ABT6SGD3_9ACTN|nr:ABC transporter substrate-binding protein [Streptomyces sp. B-S-A6]MDI3407039.1 ABC transporter substrate-binding protein [Streptomyces sp. B-S-A6]